jgi:hypothetical protein
MGPVRTEQDLDQLRLSAAAYATIIAWSKHGLIDAMTNGEVLSVHDLPANADAIRNTAPVLAHLGLLIRHPQPDGSTAWSLSHSAQSLVQAGVLPMERAWAGLDDLTRLHSVLEHGGPVRDREGRSRVTSGGVVRTNPEQTKAFMDMLYRRSAVSSKETARLLAPWITEGGHALDLGGGHGRYGAALLARGMRVTLFDRSICCDIARERYGSTISTIDGDFMTDELGGPYDLALLSNIVHGCTPDELDSILMRLRKVVVPGGVLAIKDMFLNEAMDRPESAALFGMTMLLYTEGGRSYTHPEMHEALGQAGFDQLDCIEVPDQHFTLLIAR